LLVAILAGLLSYCRAGRLVFSRRWVAPTILSPTDERVLPLSLQLGSSAGATGWPASAASCRRGWTTAERVLAQQVIFQQQFRTALRGPRRTRAELSMLLALRGKYMSRRTRCSPPIAPTPGRPHARRRLLAASHEVAELRERGYCAINTRARCDE